MILRQIFVDTSAWLALADAGDDRHAAAVEIYPTILRPDTRLFTSNLVIAESYTLIRRRIGHAAAINFLQSMRASTRLERVYSDAAMEFAAERVLQRYADQSLSFTDAVSFAFMRQSKITEAFAFDQHFQMMGFLSVG